MCLWIHKLDMKTVLSCCIKQQETSLFLFKLILPSWRLFKEYSLLQYTHYKNYLHIYTI